MRTKKTSKNKQHSTKLRAFATKLRLSNICRALALVAVVKLVVLLALVFDMPMGLVNIGSKTVKRIEVAGTANATQNIAQSVIMPLETAQASSILGGSNSTPAAGQASEPKCPDPVDPMLRQTLEKRQTDLDRREQELNALEGKVTTKLEDMKALEGRLQMMIKDAKDIRDEKLKHLIDVYTNMKAQQAAAVIETLDERTAVKILAGMRGKQAGEILTNVKAEKAAKLSEMLTKMQLPFE